MQSNRDLGCFETGKLADFRQLANKPSFRPNVSGTPMQNKPRFAQKNFESCHWSQNSKRALNTVLKVVRE
jgi:hypothetical protein